MAKPTPRVFTISREVTCLFCFFYHPLHGICILFRDRLHCHGRPGFKCYPSPVIDTQHMLHTLNFTIRMRIFLLHILHTLMHLVKSQHGSRRHQTPPSVWCCSLAGYLEYTPSSVAYSCPFCANVMSSTKPEVHNISQRR